MIQKLYTGELAGKTCSKVNCKCILVDTEPKENLICDAVETIEGIDNVYYTDIAIPLNDLPFALTEQELDELRQ